MFFNFDPRDLDIPEEVREMMMQIARLQMERQKVDGDATQEIDKKIKLLTSEVNETIQALRDRAICAIDFHPRYWPLLIHKE